MRMHRRLRVSTWMILATAIILLGTMAIQASDTPASVSRDLPRPAKPSKSYTIGVALPLLANPHFQAHAYGYYDEAAALGAKVILNDAGGYMFLDRQIKQIEDMIQTPVDALILVAADLQGTIPAVEQAVAAGIPVINVNVMTASDKVSTRIRSDDAEIGRLQAEYLAAALGGKGKVAMLRGPAGTSISIYRGDGFKEGVKKYPGMQILVERYSENDAASALKIMEDLIIAYPDLNAVVSIGNQLGLGAGQAILGAGKVGKILNVTADISPDVVAAIKDGRITATIVQSPAVMARWGVRAAINVLEGRATAKEYFTPLVVADRKNLDQIQLEGVAVPPTGWKPPRQ